MSMEFGMLRASFASEKQDTATQILTRLRILMYCFENAHSASVELKYCDLSKTALLHIK